MSVRNQFIFFASIFLVALGLMFGIERLSIKYEYKTIGQACRERAPHFSQFGTDWYWTDDQNVPDNVCAHMYSIKQREPLKFAIEIIQPNGDVSFAAFEEQRTAETFVNGLRYQRRTIINGGK